ncbi:MAG: EutN/CcmL family microcompartment protein [Deltaproteobacteria bacterium]|nr:EutN/CcmL family microcompartment protein [Deltaproteobacteria bacterium]
MKLCRVLGNVVATEKHPAYHGLTLLVVQPLDAACDDSGASFLAVDRVQAGPGDTVLVNQEGNGARQLFSIDKLPIRSVIVGIVDDVSSRRGAEDRAASR